jgi:hypothetical protein
MPHLKKDGTPDMRYKENKAMYGSQNASTPSRLSSSSYFATAVSPAPGPLKRDGTPDMRYKVNQMAAASTATAPAVAAKPVSSGNAVPIVTGIGSMAIGPLKADGTPDMRFAINKALFKTPQSQGSSAMQRAGASDNINITPLKLFASPVHAKSGDSRPQTAPSTIPGQHLKKDGTPDMRFRENKELVASRSTTANAPVQEGPKKKDGTPDMRFRENRGTLEKTTLATSHNITSTGEGPRKKDGTLDMRFKVNKEAAQRQAQSVLINLKSPAKQGVKRAQQSNAVFLHAGEQPESGHTFLMYHGTSVESAEKIRKEGFKPSLTGRLGKGVYLSRDYNKARPYAEQHGSRAEVLLVLVDVGKVCKITPRTLHIAESWRDHGFDTAWVPPNTPGWLSNLEEDCVWDPARIILLDSVQGPAPDISKFQDLVVDS